MINIVEDLKKVIEKDKNLKEKNDEYINLIRERDDYFKEIVQSLNNYREELQNEYGVPNYNYSTLLSLKDGDDIRNNNYHFKVVFHHYPSANELKIIEDITGCKINGQSYRDNVFYFKLPEIILYDRARFGESRQGL